jgi:hypothetical protein
MTSRVVSPSSNNISLIPVHVHTQSLTTLESPVTGEISVSHSKAWTTIYCKSMGVNNAATPALHFLFF